VSGLADAQLPGIRYRQRFVHTKQRRQRESPKGRVGRYLRVDKLIRILGRDCRFNKKAHAKYRPMVVRMVQAPEPKDGMDGVVFFASYK